MLARSIAPTSQAELSAGGPLLCAFLFDTVPSIHSDVTSTQVKRQIPPLVKFVLGFSLTQHSSLIDMTCFVSVVIRFLCPCPQKNITCDCLVKVATFQWKNH